MTAQQRALLILGREVRARAAAWHARVGRPDRDPLHARLMAAVSLYGIARATLFGPGRRDSDLRWWLPSGWLDPQRARPCPPRSAGLRGVA